MDNELQFAAKFFDAVHELLVIVQYLNIAKNPQTSRQTYSIVRIFVNRPRY